MEDGPLNVVVLAKFVPNPSGAPPEIGPDFRLTRAEADAGLDPSDEPGLELAVRLVESRGGTATVFSVGPERAGGALVRALAFGADAAVLVADDALAGADVLATATVLAAAIRGRPFDLIVAGVESSDGGTGTLPIALAELLDLPAATFARRVDVAGGTLTIERQTSSGYDVVDCPLPALVSVTAAAAAPRYPSLRETIQAKRRPIERLSLADVGLTAADVRPLQRVSAVEIAPDKEPGELVEDETGALARIVHLLEEAKVL
ncbi:MAG TPA: electron transfer flavoprotein subunit beta/FixA family protein [Gaiellaceae bacterium]|jgi:electron transfer flavoprotein beta subunit